MAAVEVAHGAPFDGHTRLIAHALRDLVNRLPDEVDGRRGERFDYAPAVSELRASWLEEGLPIDVILQEDGSPVAQPPGQTIPSRVVGQIQSLLRGHDAVSGRNRRDAERMFAVLTPQDGADAGGAGPLVRRWLDLGRWAASKAHYASDRSDLSREECMGQLEAFEAMLGGMVRRFFEVTRGLDEILEEANS